MWNSKKILIVKKKCTYIHKPHIFTDEMFNLTMRGDLSSKTKNVIFSANEFADNIELCLPNITKQR